MARLLAAMVAVILTNCGDDDGPTVADGGGDAARSDARTPGDCGPTPDGSDEICPSECQMFECDSLCTDFCFNDCWMCLDEEPGHWQWQRVEIDCFGCATEDAGVADAAGA